tara:strand:- start:1575 stop:2165 length:591 start_codon:yes stop_codon:yes gene_type:complete
MIKILHQVNKKKELLNTQKTYGVEVDIRSYGERLIIHHDPFTDGEDFLDWITAYNHEALILNVKEEGLEERLISILREKKIENYFFLDQSFPFLMKTINSGESRVAIRVSEFESIETAMNLRGKVDWLWIDCFTKFPIKKVESDVLRNECGFKLCFVSPELQGRANKSGIITFRKEIESEGIYGDAVCTKYPEIWE